MSAAYLAFRILAARLAAPFAALATTCAIAAPANAVSLPTPERNYGAYASLNGFTTGGAYQSAAQASRSTAYVQAAASGAVRDGALHASVFTTQDGYNSCGVFDAGCRWGDTASTWVWDVATVSAEDLVGNAIDWSISMDGDRTRGRWNGSTWAEAYYYVGTNPRGWNNPVRLTLGEQNQVGGTIDIMGSNTKVYAYMALMVHADNGATADYSHTMQFDWLLPTGATYASASGQFMADRPQPVPPASAAPEPAGWALMIVGFGSAGALLRRGRSLAERAAAPGAEIGQQGADGPAAGLGDLLACEAPLLAHLDPGAAAVQELQDGGRHRRLPLGQALRRRAGGRAESGRALVADGHAQRPALRRAVGQGDDVGIPVEGSVHGLQPRGQRRLVGREALGRESRIEPLPQRRHQALAVWEMAVDGLAGDARAPGQGVVGQLFHLAGRHGFGQGVDDEAARLRLLPLAQRHGGVRDLLHVSGLALNLLRDNL